MQGLDIRVYKTKLRHEMKKKRAALLPQEKQQLDRAVTERFLSLRSYKEADVLLLYASTAIEVDTYGILADALEKGKTVALPRCVVGERNMDFYIVSSQNDLVKGSFGVMEPDPTVCQKLTDLSKGLCVIPALWYDKDGYRIGYGAGYYDRFLSRFSGKRIGLAYHFCMKDKLIHGKFDLPAEIVVTNREVIYPKGNQ